VRVLHAAAHQGTTNGVAIHRNGNGDLVDVAGGQFLPTHADEAEPVSAFLPQPIIPLRATAPSAAAIMSFDYVAFEPP